MNIKDEAVEAFTQYRRKQIAELRPYQNGEDMIGVSISAEDYNRGSPKSGDMIARNPKNHADQWLVAAAYFADNFEPLTALPHLSQGAVNLPLEGLFRPLEGVEQNQPGFHHAKGWNDAIMHCMDLQRALSPAPVGVTDEMVALAYGKWVELNDWQDWDEDETKRLLRAALTAALPHMGGVRVKPLEWHEHVKGVHRAETIVGDYRVWTHHEADGLVFWRLSDGGAKAEGQGTEAECYAAAQADYERRILSAIEVSASPHPTIADKLEVVGFIVKADWTESGYVFAGESNDTDAEPLVRQSALTACQQEVGRLTQERDEALEAENEAKDCFWAIYPDWVDMKGHGITTEAARTLLADRAEAAEARNAELVKALAGLIDYVDQNTCVHENVHRGGAIWTICDECGEKWADDRGGFIPHVDPEPVASARAALGGQSNE